MDFKPDVPVVLYSGSIGEKQGLEAVLEIAENFKQKNIEIQFIISRLWPLQKYTGKPRFRKAVKQSKFFIVATILKDSMNF